MLKYWIEFFDDLQNVRGRSRNTVMAYRRDLEIYKDFTDTTNDIEKIYDFLQKRGLSKRSQARVISSIRTYLKFCELKGEKVDELRSLRPPKVKVGLPKTLSLQDFERLVDAAVVEDLQKTKRNQLTLLLLFGLGCRVSELIALDLHDFNETQGWLKILGKGGKERLVPLTDNLLMGLTHYLKEVRPNLIKLKSNAVLMNDRGKRPSRVDIWRLLDAWSKKAGFEETMSPHRFRHGCATSLLEGGADLRSIQMLLGHSSIQTTQVYTHVNQKQMKSEIKQFHPLSDVEK